jgi:alkylation response protein AidB-like acyl-CoA dehydrogenase
VELELDNDQQLFWETSRKFIESSCPLATVRQLYDDPDGFDRGWWRQVAELGWTSMLVPEEHGGGTVSGNGLLDLVLVAEEMGRWVSPGPFLPTNVVAATVARSGSAEQKKDLLGAVVAGELTAAWCFDEPGTRWGPAGVGLTARADGGDFVLVGTKSPVEAAAQADHLLVTARTGEGLGQFLVPADTPGVRVTPLRSLDFCRRFATVSFEDVRVPESAVVGAPGGAAGDVEVQIQLAAALQCAETVGAVDRVFEFTTQYAFDRFSFGRPLASYQALKHRFADMKTWLEACHATATSAARGVQEGADDAGDLASVAKSYVGERSVDIIQDCVQMHGGIGVTWEHDIHLYLRRATVNRETYGTPADHRERLASLLGM